MPELYEIERTQSTLIAFLQAENRRLWARLEACQRAAEGDIANPLCGANPEWSPAYEKVVELRKRYGRLMDVPEGEC